MASTVARSFSDEERTKRFLPRELRNYSWPMSWLISRAEMDRKRGGGRKVVLVRELADDRKPLYLSPLSIRLISSFVRDCLWKRLWSCVVLFNWNEFCSFLFLFSFLECSRILMRKDRTLVGKVKLMVKPIPSLPDH